MGLVKLKQVLMLVSSMATMAMVTTLAMATMDTMAMDTHTGTMDTTMARGLLMPSLRPLLMLTMAMDTMAMDTMAMPMPMDTMLTHMPTTMATSMARGLQMPSPLLMLPMLT